MGWSRPKILPFQNFSMHPASKVFHYGIELFEGLKAYRGADNVIRLFRPDKNMERMIETANRCEFPDFDGNELIGCIKKLISIDRDWVPNSQSSTLYIRPSMIATEPCIGIGFSNQTKLFVITGPVGAYYQTGLKPVSLLADPQFVRAFEGGTGYYKMGCNYAPTIQIQLNALNDHNCQQVLWLYGPERELTEVGTMNIFIYWINESGERELITPSLEKKIVLPGVTRLSLLELTRKKKKFKVTEGRITMSQIIKALNENRLIEMFGSGTACVVCPVNKILYDKEWYEIPTMEQKEPLCLQLYSELTDIQYGRKSSDWVEEVVESTNEKDVLSNYNL
ncbi:DgyrCDS9447 [Dimorphilus gyrociliatus]|uniref:Branched-chain-amino-acid aminotransferase n=1 Tax=Dimorphilus gyrociliatus TaxID=2664684 RepID=A0A7I8VYP5_9ANNE|nr:DgyrCDS9447 [Dimorphilus gyrociliatus]